MFPIQDNIAQPSPILITDNYPSAPTMTSAQSQTISSPTVQYNIKVEDTETLFLLEDKAVYSYHHNLSSEETSIPIFFNFHQKQALWKIATRDWHGITLSNGQLNITISTTPPHFRFTFNQNTYHWQINEEIIPYKLECFNTKTKKLVAQLDGYKIVLDVHEDTTNPFRKSSNFEDDPFTIFILLSSVLVNNHIKSLLKSLGDGPEALQMMIDQPASIDTPEHHHQNNKTAADAVNNMYKDDDDMTSLSSTYSRHYTGHQSLVEGRGDSGNRWSSSAQSFKSIELNPSVWQCWWGGSFWWAWFPCCMPGGCCDRACIRLKGHKPRHTRNLSKQGWKQQHY